MQVRVTGLAAGAGAKRVAKDALLPPGARLLIPKSSAAAAAAAEAFAGGGKPAGAIRQSSRPAMPAADGAAGRQEPLHACACQDRDAPPLGAGSSRSSAATEPVSTKHDPSNRLAFCSPLYLMLVLPYVAHRLPPARGGGGGLRRGAAPTGAALRRRPAGNPQAGGPGGAGRPRWCSPRVMHSCKMQHCNGCCTPSASTAMAAAGVAQTHYFTRASERRPARCIC